jgi:hypothetical protein
MNNESILPVGIKITGIALVVLCGLQIIGWNVMMVIAASKLRTSITDFVIYSTGIMGALTPLLGVVAGVGVLLMKSWGRTAGVIFSAIAIILYGSGFSLALYMDGALRHSISSVIAPIAVLLGLPIWTIYYFTRERIKTVFS